MRLVRMVFILAIAATASSVMRALVLHATGNG